MPERILDLYRDMIHQIRSRRKLSPTLHYAVLDASTENLAQEILGSVLHGGTSKAEMILYQLEYKDSQPGARTRIVTLKAPLPVGATVSGRTDLLPVEQ
jgi:hypothetical protein